MREVIWTQAIASAALLGIALLACAEKRRARHHGPTPSAEEPAPHEEPGPLERRISVSYRNARLPGVLDDLKERAGLRSAYVRLVDRGFTFSFEAEGVTVREVLEKLAEAGGLAFDCQDDAVVFWRESDEELRRELRRKPVTFEFEGTPLKEALEFIEAASEVEIALDPRVDGAARLSIKAAGMSVHQTLVWIVRTCSLEYAVCAGTVYVTRADLLDSLPITAHAKGPPESPTPEQESDQDRAAVERLEKSLADADPRARAEALWNMERIGGERVVDLLERALVDKDRDVRVAAASGLGYIGGERAEAALERAVLDPDGFVQQPGLKALALTNCTRAVGPLETALRILASSVRLSAVAGLDMQCNAKALALLLRALGMKAQEDDSMTQEHLRWMREKKVSFEFVDTPLEEAISFLQTMAKANMIADPECVGDIGRCITVKAKEVSFEEALNLLLEDTGLTWVLADFAIFVATREELAGWGDACNGVRARAFEGLRRFRGNAVRDAMLARAAVEPHEGLRKTIVQFLSTSFAGDAAVEKALNGLKESRED